MITGWYDPRNGRPFVRGLVTVHQLGIQYTVNFLVDTGADLTCLHYPDVAIARVNHQLLSRSSEMIGMEGVGGSAEYFITPARVDFLNVPDRRHFPTILTCASPPHRREALNVHPYWVGTS